MSNRRNTKWSKVRQCDRLVAEAAAGLGSLTIRSSSAKLEEGASKGKAVVVESHVHKGLLEMLPKILTYLPTLDIKSCNGVCHLWREEARKVLLKRTRLDFGGGRVADLEGQVLSYIEDMGKDSDCHESVGIQSLGYNDREYIAILEFGNNYGGRIKKLYMRMGNPNMLFSYPNVSTLSIGLDVNANATQRINIPHDLIMSSVKTLSLEIPVSDVDRDGPPILSDSGLALSLLKMCPMLEHLYLHNGTQQTFIGLFQQYSVPIQLIGLGLIGIEFIVNQRSPQRMNNLAALRLTVLELDFTEVTYRATLSLSAPLQQVLANFASTLKHLKLHRIPCGNHMPTASTITLPEMPHLERLEITYLYDVQFQNNDLHSRKYGSVLNFTLGKSDYGININYMQKFPLLKKLSIQHVGEPVNDSYVNFALEFCEMLFPEGTPSCDTMTHVDVDCISNVRHGDNCKRERHCFCKKKGPIWKMIRRMITMFPNVEEFKHCRGWQF